MRVGFSQSNPDSLTTAEKIFGEKEISFQLSLPSGGILLKMKLEKLEEDEDLKST